MKKMMLVAVLSAVSSLSMASTEPPLATFAEQPVHVTGSTTAIIEDNTITLTSPRTGVGYTLIYQPNARYALQTEAIAVATAETAQRIEAKNPALSVESQEQARQALIQALTQ